MLKGVFMSELLKHADVLSEGLLLTFQDGREALIEGKDLLACAEQNNAFERVKPFQEQAAADVSEESDLPKEPDMPGEE